MKKLTAANVQDLSAFFPLLKQLRTKLDFNEFLNIYSSAHKENGYELTGFYQGESLIALVGYRTMYDFVRGRHLYIDDLVIESSVRSKGVGAQVLKYAEDLAIELKCSGGLRLCAGLDNADGIRFYEKNGWKARAFAFVKNLDSKI